MRGKKVTWGLLALAVILLLGSTLGSTRAALTYYSENYVAEITVSQIGVTLLENDDKVSSRDYNDNEWNESSNREGAGAVSGVLLENMLKEGEKLALNKEYPERLAVLNSGSIDEYVRVRVYRYWMKEENGTKRKVTTLAPSLIDLNFVNEDHWIVRPFDTEEGERECVELYYKGILPAGSMTELFADTIRIDGSLSSAAKVEVNGSTITTTYQYDGVEFHVDVEVDAVQTHNARDAIRSAWGIDASALGILQEDVE